MPFTRQALFTFSIGDDDSLSVVLDEANDFMYCYVTNKIKRVRISTLTEVASLNETTHNGSLAIDTVNGFLYFMTTSSQQVKKVSLSSFTVVATLALTGMATSSGKICQIDIPNQLLYAGDNINLAKVNLATFTQVGSALTFTGGNLIINAGALDLENNLGYFVGHVTAAGPVHSWRVVKVDLSNMTQSAILTGFEGTPSGSTSDLSYSVHSAMLDDLTIVPIIVDDFITGYNAKHFLYFPTYTTGVVNNINIVRIDIAPILDAFGAPTGLFNFALDSVLPIQSAFRATDNVMDTGNGFGYIVESVSPGKIHIFNLSDFLYYGNITLNTGEDFSGDGYGNGILLNAAKNAFYVSCTNTSPGKIVRIGTADPMGGAKTLNRKTSPYTWGQTNYN